MPRERDVLSRGFGMRSDVTERLGSSMSEVLAYLGDEDGASAAEYALILAIIGATIAAAMLFLGNSIVGAVNNAANCISNHSTTNCG
jgi:pilus assembly protein Flp/PilA